MNPPETRYAVAPDGVHIAYQVLGDGPLDLVFCAEFWNSMEAQWEEPGFARFLRRLASFARLICFDQRGTGLSDPVSLEELPTLEQWMEDVLTVMEAVGSDRAALLSSGGGCLMATLFAATRPDRTTALVVVNGFGRLSSSNDNPDGTSPAFEEDVRREMREGWGRGVFLDVVAPTRVSDGAFAEWWGRYQRLGSSLGTVLAMRDMLTTSDVRDVLESIRVPALVIHRRDNRLVPAALGRDLAARIPGSRYVEVEGSDYFPFSGDADAILEHVEEFLTGSRHAVEPNRILTSLVFTDIVGSTARAAELGDRRWREVLDAHHAAVRTALARFRGREIDTAGDGFLATFDGPARAVRCAAAIRDAVRALGLEVRAGVHTGEVELVPDDIRGIAVHIGARVAAMAGAGEILVSSTVRDLVVGSGIQFEDRGAHELKGVPGEWHLYAVTSSA